MDERAKVSIVSSEPERDGADLELGRQIGIGGMGVIREALDPNLQRRMAVKLLHRQSARDPKANRRFIEEAQVTAQLDHPNIVPVHELGKHRDGGLFFTMKLVEGATLRTRLAQTPPPTARQQTSTDSCRSSSSCATRSHLPTAAASFIAISNRTT